MVALLASVPAGKYLVGELAWDTLSEPKPLQLVPIELAHSNVVIEEKEGSIVRPASGYPLKE
jgi:hypothetical protein